MKTKLTKALSVILLLMLIVTACFIPTQAASTTETVTIADASEDTVWSYLDNNTDPATGLDSLTAWTLPSFETTDEWKTGSGTFGSKSGALAAINGLTPTVLLPLQTEGASTNSYAYFFRLEFTIEDVDTIRAMPISVNADDAVVVYLNGNVIFDTRVTKETTTNLYYSGCNSVYKDTTWLSTDELREYATDGTNVIAAEVHNSAGSSSDIYFDLSASAIIGEASDTVTFTDMVLNIGGSESERNFNWYTDSKKQGEVQLALKSDMTGEDFPNTYTSVTATTAKTDNAPGRFHNKATVTALSEKTEYVYRFACGEDYSDIYSFTTGSFGDYEFTVLGDPQLRGLLYDRDKATWADTLSVVSENFNPAFLVSVGDQVDHVGDYDWEIEYEMFINEYLKSMAIATTVGNHDRKATSYGEHFNMPNLTEYGKDAYSADYWYTYGNTLFMNINFWGGEMSDHISFMEEAIEANPDCIWKVVVTHPSFFSAGSHINDTDVTKGRAALPDAITELGIDVVFSGHDHIYTRTYLMDGTSIATDQSNNDASGVLYICAGATGTKFYAESEVSSGTGYEYVASTFYSQQRVVINVEVTDTSFVITTYRVDDMTLLDTYSLTKGETGALNAKIAEAEKVLERAEKKLSKNEYQTLASLIDEAKALIESYTDTSELSEMVDALDVEIARIYELFTTVDIWSSGAKETAFDIAENVKVIHLDSEGSYSVSSTGTNATFYLYKTVDGVTETVATWTEGKSVKRYQTTSELNANPYVVFILDDNVTFTGIMKWYATNILFDLNGYNLILEGGSGIAINLKSYASIEFRGEGSIIWMSGGSQMVTADSYYSTFTLNGDITIDDRTTSGGNYLFYLKGWCFVYGTLTIGEGYDSSSGSVFYTHGSRSSAIDAKCHLNIVDATINANNHGGASLFYAKGVSGQYEGVTYTSIPEVNVTNSTLNVKCPLANALWGKDTVSGVYANNTSQPLTDCINVTKLNIINSRVNADLYYDTTFTDTSKVALISPMGYTTVTIKDSVIENEQGRVLYARNGANLTVVCDNSVITAKTSELDTDAMKTSMSWSSASILKSVVMTAKSGAVGTASFTDCKLSAEYRIFEGTTTDATAESFFITCKNNEIILDTAITGANSTVTVRSNVVFDGDIINCGKGTLTYVVLPYNPSTGTGVLYKNGTKLINLGSSSYDTATGNKYLKTVSEYATLAESDATIYTTYSSGSNTGTIEDGTVFYKLSYGSTVSGRYSYRLINSDLASLMSIAPMSNITLYSDFIYNVYVPVLDSITKIELDGVSYTDLKALTITNIDGADYYTVSCRVSLREAAETFTLRLTATLQDGTSRIGTWSLSVVSHLEDTLALEGATETTIALAKDILSYIRAAYAYADIDEADIERINDIIGDDYDQTSMPDTTIIAAEKFDGLASVSISLGDAPAFIFYVAEGYDASAFRFTAGSKVLSSEVLTDSEGKTYIKVAMYAYLMTETISYAVDGADTSGEYNIKSYYEFAKTLKNEELNTLVERLWKYAESAKAYKAEIDG